MEFFSLKDKFDSFRNAYSTGDKLASGAAVIGTVIANAAIATGKVAVAVMEKTVEEAAKHKK